MFGFENPSQKILDVEVGEGSFHISSSWVKIGLYTQNKLSWMSGSALTNIVGGLW